MRSFVLVAAAIAGLGAMSMAARADDAATEKSAPVKGPPNANGSEGSTPHSGQMKGPPNADGYGSKQGPTQVK